jgi:hypothetical protein
MDKLTKEAKQRTSLLPYTKLTTSSSPPVVVIDFSACAAGSSSVSETDEFAWPMDTRVEKLPLGMFNFGVPVTGACYLL